MGKLRTLAHVFKQMDELQTLAAQLLREACPVGAEVQYEHGDRLRTVTVVEHALHGHLHVWVVGATGTRYSVPAWSILKAMVEDFGR